MLHRRMVLQQHINQWGSVFGGTLSAWVDEVGYITTNSDYPNHKFVTKQLNIEFKKPVEVTDVIVFKVEECPRPINSVKVIYNISVVIDKGNLTNWDWENEVLKSSIVLVNVDENGMPTNIE